MMVENGLSDIYKDRIKSFKGADIIRHTSDERWYAPSNRSNQWKPSVTTIIGGTIAKGIGFEQWLGNQPSYDLACQVRDKAAERGTMVHNMVECLLKGEEVVIEDDKEASKHMMSFMRFWKENNVKVLNTEIFLWHEDCYWAGTPDIICELNGKLAIIDLKTGQEHKTHEIQLNMYAELVRKTFKMDTIEMFALYTKGKWIKEPNYKLKRVKDSGAMFDTYNLWHWLNTTRGEPKPKYKAKLDSTFKLPNKENRLMEHL